MEGFHAGYPISVKEEENVFALPERVGPEPL
jgi:hypothetical protein